MKKIIVFVFIVMCFLFSLCYQSILIDRSMSNIPFVANIFVSEAKVKKFSYLQDEHSGYYIRKLNDSINNYHQISQKPSYNYRVTSIAWEVRYENMNQENLLKFLDNHDLFLFTKLDSINDLYKRKVIFINEAKQYLVGFYDEGSYYLRYSCPRAYVTYENRNTFKTSLKDFLIGAPH